MNSHIGPLLTDCVSQQFWHEEQVVVVNPNKITWLKYGCNALGKHLICLCTEMNTQVGDAAQSFAYLVIMNPVCICGCVLCGDILPEQIMEQRPKCFEELVST